MEKPALGSSAHHTCVQLCHLRLAALYRIAEGRQQPDDASLVSGAESLLARRGLTPRDFGFVDPPHLSPIDCASPEVRARAIWKIPAGKRVVY
jgi:hypothetical protein